MTGTGPPGVLAVAVVGAVVGAVVEAGAGAVLTRMRSATMLTRPAAGSASGNRKRARPVTTPSPGLVSVSAPTSAPSGRARRLACPNTSDLASRPAVNSVSPRKPRSRQLPVACVPSMRTGRVFGPSFRASDFTKKVPPPSFRLASPLSLPLRPGATFRRSMSRLFSTARAV